MTRFFLFFSILFFTNVVRVSATHIIGNSISYQYLSGGKYLFTMHVYRDCYIGAAPFDGEEPNSKGAAIWIFKEVNGKYQQVDNVSVLLSKKQYVAAPDLGGAVVPPSTCVEEAIYQFEYKIADFPSTSTYRFAYQRCCRNVNIVNLLNPLTTGTTSEVQISPQAQILANNSAVFKIVPPTIICANKPISIDVSASDVDKDSLYYRFYTPVNGGSDINPIPIAPSTPPFDKVSYKNGYSADNPLGNSALTLNSKTGLLTGSTTTVGQFVVGISIEEYRNGQLINTTYRDFQFNVTACSPLGDEDTISDSMFSVYPNPTKDKVFIIMQNKKNAIVGLYNIQGQLLLSQENMTQLADNQYEVNVAHLPKGVYFLKINVAEKVGVKKIVVE
jgi:hypothetical protein